MGSPRPGLNNCWLPIPTSSSPAFLGRSASIAPRAKTALTCCLRTQPPPLVVEIKAVKCGVPSVRQLLRYLDLLEPEHPHIRGILIGFGMNEGAARLLRRHKTRLSFLKLDHDVPTPSKVVFCAECRMAYFRTRQCPNGHEGVI